MPGSDAERLSQEGETLVCEQREWNRYPPHPQTSCELILSKEIRFRALAIRNISLHGMTLVLDRTLTIGSTPMVELRSAGGHCCKRPMRIIYLFRDPAGDVVLGGSFARNLTETELRPLI